MIVENCVG